MLAFHNYTYRLNCKHQFTYLQTIAKLRTFYKKQLDGVNLCYYIPLSQVSIQTYLYHNITLCKENGDDNSLKQKHIRQKSSTAILQYCSFILCLKWATANSFYEMSPRLIIYYLSYLIFTCKNKKSNKFCDGQKLIIRLIHPSVFRFCKKKLVGMFS